MTFLAKFPTTTNTTGALVEFIEWTAIEVDLGVVIASLPSMHALFRRIWPKSKSTLSGNAYGYGSSGPRSTPGTTGKWSNGGIHFSQKVDQFVELRDMSTDSDTKGPQTQTTSYGKNSPPPTGNHSAAYALRSNPVQQKDVSRSPERRNGPLRTESQRSRQEDPFHPEGYTHYAESW